MCFIVFFTSAPGPNFFFFFPMEDVSFPSCIVSYHLSLLSFCKDVQTGNFFSFHPSCTSATAPFPPAHLCAWLRKGKYFNLFWDFVSWKSVFKQIKQMSWSSTNFMLVKITFMLLNLLSEESIAAMMKRHCSLIVLKL